MVVSRWIILRMRNVTEKKIVQKIESHFMFRNFLPKIVPFKRHVEKYCTAELAMDDTKIRRIRFTCWITEARHARTHARTRAHTHIYNSEYVKHIVFLRQHWLPERASMLRYSTVTYLSLL